MAVASGVMSGRGAFTVALQIKPGAPYHQAVTGSLRGTGRLTAAVQGRWRAFSPSGSGKITASIRPKIPTTVANLGAGRLAVAARLYRIASTGAISGKGMFTASAAATYPYLGPMGWTTENMFMTYQLGCLTHQPNIEPGGQFFDPTKTSVLTYMAFASAAGLTAMTVIDNPQGPPSVTIAS